MRRNILILIVALVAAACGGADSGAAPDDSSSSTVPLGGPDEPYALLTISEEGGFVPVHFNLRRIPRFVVMSDGTVYSQAPTTLEFPGPAVQPVQVGQIGQEALDEIVARIRAAGLDEIVDENNDAAAARVADATTTVFEYTDPEGERHRFTVYALGMTDVDYEDERVADLQALATTVSEVVASATDTEIWDPDAVQVHVSEELFGYDPEFANTMDYPLDRAYEDLETSADAVAEYRCMTLEGSEAADLLATWSSANEATTFVDADGNEYSIVVKPLLPGQEGCAS